MNARELWVRANQLTLKEQQGFNHIMVQLNCKVGEDGIICCLGRMKNAKYSRKYQSSHYVMENTLLGNVSRIPLPHQGHTPAKANA